MDSQFRCKCPITTAVDILGDRWTLVIVKQMLFEQKVAFKEFVESPEAIATNILSDRLKRLEALGLVMKQKLLTNKKTNVYTLTEKGLALTPVLVELILWSTHHLKDNHPGLDVNTNMESVERDKQGAYDKIMDNYRNHVRRTLQSSSM